MSSILAFIEVRDGAVQPIARETLAAARSLADGLGMEVDAVALGGPGLAAALSEVAGAGAHRIHVGETDALDRDPGAVHTDLLARFVSEHGCAAAIFPATATGKDLAPRVAARLEAGYAAECTGIEVENDGIIAIRPQYAGKVIARVSFTRAPAILSVRRNAFRPVEGAGEATILPLDVSLDASADLGAVLREIRARAGAKLDVGEAPVVVSGGRGLRDAEGFRLLEELADALGNAAVGASRAVVDEGWRPHSEQVGQTGKTVSPQLYFAIGISGAIQHLAGMRTARYIVAINKDPEAPIFKIADYGIVGDLFEIVPRLTQAIREPER